MGTGVSLSKKSRTPAKEGKRGGGGGIERRRGGGIERREGETCTYTHVTLRNSSSVTFSQNMAKRNNILLNLFTLRSFIFLIVVIYETLSLR